jgi:hypothetical protein
MRWLRSPVVVDECGYEGNIPYAWGNLSAQELVHRFWLGTAHGGYVGHGETYEHPDNLLWWSKGGILRGESGPRLAFLWQILEDGPAAGLEPCYGVAPEFLCVGRPYDYYLIYFGVHQPAQLAFDLPDNEQYSVEVIDPWVMTMTRLDEPVARGASVRLPGEPYRALILRRVHGSVLTNDDELSATSSRL